MRTSRAAKDTANLFQALSPPRTRQTRSSALRDFAFNASSSTPSHALKEEPPDSDDASSLSSVDTVDMEDILDRPVKRRKVTSASAKDKKPSRTVAGKTTKNGNGKENGSGKKVTKPPARKAKSSDTPVKVEPPPNWARIYDTVKRMREENPTAPVDTMGCAELYWRASSPKDRRFQTLVALMLSSQTKDTVTAVAMQRLHTELGDSSAQGPIIKTEDEDETKSKDSKDSTLNLANILAVPPTRLNELIGLVGFHNNKTKYIKSTAQILHDKYDSDIPSTAEELMSIPGVGPKMAYLCMSAAWGKHEGIGVDVHVHRITNLWGWHKTKTPEETRKVLEGWLPRDKWHEINKLLVGLGQTVCLPVGRRCGECALAGEGLCKGEVKGDGLNGSRRKGKGKVESGLGENGVKVEEEV